MRPEVLRTEDDYEQAMTAISELLGAAPGSPEAEDLELWSRLVEDYEEEHYPIPLPDPVEAIRFRLEQQGLTEADLIPYLGSEHVVSEVLAGKRRLSRAMIRELHNGLGIPAAVLRQGRRGKGSAQA